MVVDRQISKKHFDRIFGPDSGFISHEEKLVELLRLMDDQTPQEDGQTASWHAHGVAELLRDDALYPTLQRLLDSARKEATKRHLYFVISRLGENTRTADAAIILQKRISLERVPFTLMCLLDGLAELKEISDCTSIINLIEDKRWMVRHAAIRALGGCRDPQAERALIGIVERSEDPDDLTYAHAALGQIGTARAIPALMKRIHHRKEDVKASAIHALMMIGDARLTPVFLDALKDPSPAAKVYAILALDKHGDSSAVLPVCERIRSILKRTRKTWADPKTELIMAIDFILRFRHDVSLNAEIEKTLDVIGKRWNRLFSEEKAWIADLLPDRYANFPKAKADDHV